MSGWQEAGELRAELAALVAGFRAQLARRARCGLWAVPAGASSRPAAAELGAEEPSGPGHGGSGADRSISAGLHPVASPGDTALERGPGRPDPGTPDLVDSGEDGPGATRLSLALVREQLGDCQRCKLAGKRRNIVFGVGSPQAPLMFIGEAPGADEDRLGEPFVGRAGQLLDRMIAAMGWTRDTVYIANVLKCRPPGNRDPEPDEVAACAPFLGRQIAAISPRIIVALGRPAAQNLLGTQAPISALRGKFHSYRGIKVMPTFHPAFLLRSPDRKRDAWADLKQVIAELERLGITPPQPPGA